MRLEGEDDEGRRTEQGQSLLRRCRRTDGVCEMYARCEMRSGVGTLRSVEEGKGSRSSC